MTRWIGQNRGFAAALALFLALYLSYHLMHPRGFSTAVLVQNSNELVAIGLVAMAETVPVLLGGLALSVGAIMTLTTCVASWLLNGTPTQIAFGMIATLAVGTGVGLLNSALSIMQMTEALRQIIYGTVIAGMLLIYGRGTRVSE